MDLKRRILRKLTYNKLFEGSILDSELKRMLNGYINAMLWTEEEELISQTKDRGKKVVDFDLVFNIDDVDQNTVIGSYQDIKKFLSNFTDEEIEAAAQEMGYDGIGQAFWLSRNGHGSGFFDYTFDSADKMQELAKKFGELDVFVNDSGYVQVDSKNY